KDGGLTDYSTAVTVANVAPTATLAPVTGNEGRPTSVTLSNPFDPSSADTAAGLHYRFALSLAGLAGSYSTASSSNTQAFTFTDSGSYTVWGRILDKDGGLTDYSTTVTVNAVATHLVISAPASATAGSAFSITVTALDASNNPARGYT